ncbi:transporter substrate-binding domain-containing protein [Candidatus Bipolaricaulota bacterium]|nr:transporter substrate-binding domain-containing protein [Candidatus Bipolaricaulota bacterium]
MKKLFVGVVALSMVLLLGAGLAFAGDKYIVASDIPWAPFEMVTADGQFFGFDLDIVRCLAVVEGFNLDDVVIKNTAFDTIIDTVKSGKADIGASGFTITADRAKSVDFSQPYYLSNQAVVIRKDSGLNIVSALAGQGPTKKIGAQNGTTGFDWADNNGIGITVNGYEYYPTAILDLVNKRIDAVIQDEPASQSSLAAYPDLLTIAGIINTNEYFGFLVAKGDPKGLLPMMNDGMAKLGLSVLPTAGGMQKLVVTPGSVWDNLLKGYFGPTNDKIEAAWLASKDLLLVDQDVEAFAAKFAEEATK